MMYVHVYVHVSMVTKKSSSFLSTEATIFLEGFRLPKHEKYEISSNKFGRTMWTTFEK